MPASDAERFDEKAQRELDVALDNYTDDPDDNGALNRLVNNCVAVGYEFAQRTATTPTGDYAELVEVGFDAAVEAVELWARGFLNKSTRGKLEALARDLRRQKVAILSAALGRDTQCRGIR